MFAKLFSIAIIICVSYILGVFLLPSTLDQYGNPAWNEKIRELKAYLDTDRAQFGSGASLVESVTNIAKPYIEETRETVNTIKTTIDTKTEQVEKAADSIENAYSSLEQAKSDIKNLSNFGTSSTR